VDVEVGESSKRAGDADGDLDGSGPGSGSSVSARVKTEMELYKERIDQELDLLEWENAMLWD
jgi:hypothetical protein